MTWEWDLNCWRTGRREPVWVISPMNWDFCTLALNGVFLICVWVCSVCVIVKGSCVIYCCHFAVRASVQWVSALCISFSLRITSDFGNELCALFGLVILWAVKHLLWLRICDQLWVIIKVSASVWIFHLRFGLFVSIALVSTFDALTKNFLQKVDDMKKIKRFAAFGDFWWLLPSTLII